MKTALLGGLLTFALLPAVSLAAEAPFQIEPRAPAPTPAPDVEFARRNILKHRAITADGVSTCYFIAEDPTDSVTCDAGYQCAINTVEGAWGCCATNSALSNCKLATECYDSTYYYDVLPRVTTTGEIACTSSLYPYCQVYIDPVYSVTALGCGDVRDTKTVYDFASGSSTGPATVTNILLVTVAPSSGSSSTPAPKFSSSSSSQATTGPTVPAVPAQTSPAVVTTSSSGLSTGAIVGIAVAGAAVLLGAILGIGCVCFQRYRKKRNEPTVVAQPVLPNQPPYQPQVTTVDSPTGFNYVSKPVDDHRFSGSTQYTAEHYDSKAFDRPISPHDAVGEYDIGSTVMSNAGHTASVASGYNPPRV